MAERPPEPDHYCPDCGEYMPLAMNERYRLHACKVQHQARVKQIVGGKVTLPTDDVRWLLEREKKLREALELIAVGPRPLAASVAQKIARQALADSGEASG